MITGGILSLYAETSLHPGSGTGLGVVDLPVHRERHTRFPTIPSTSLKGVLRDAARVRLVTDNQAPTRKEANGHSNIVALFGGQAGKGEEDTPGAGAITITDGRLLAFPVRSMQAVFGWLTCPSVLQRLERDANLAGLSLPVGNLSVNDNSVLVVPESPLLLAGPKSVVLEEFEYKAVGSEPLKKLAEQIAERFLPVGPHFASTRERFSRQFVMVSDNTFSSFVQNATEVTARIKLDEETKTVTNGALFYEEFIPSESVFYSVVLVDGARVSTPGARPDSKALFESLQTSFIPPVLQIGANASAGRGICSTRLFTGGAR